jgi:hypothetical protein
MICGKRARQRHNFVQYVSGVFCGIRDVRWFRRRIRSNDGKGVGRSTDGNKVDQD